MIELEKGWLGELFQANAELLNRTPLEFGGTGKTLADRDHRISELEAEVAALREDRDRLEYAMEHLYIVHSTALHSGGSRIYDTRAAIDDARAKERGGV